MFYMTPVECVVILVQVGSRNEDIYPSIISIHPLYYFSTTPHSLQAAGGFSLCPISVQFVTMLPPHLMIASSNLFSEIQPGPKGRRFSLVEKLMRQNLSSRFTKLDMLFAVPWTNIRKRCKLFPYWSSIVPSDMISLICHTSENFVLGLACSCLSVTAETREINHKPCLNFSPYD